MVSLPYLFYLHSDFPNSRVVTSSPYKSFLYTGLGTGFLLIGIIFIPGYLNRVLNSGIAKTSALDTPDSVGYGVFADNTKYPLQLDIFMMNITNPIEVLNGEKPHVKEVGPFRYLVYRTAVDPKWDDERTKLSWRYYTRYIFDEANSIMPDTTVLTSVNMPFWGSVSAFLAMGGSQFVDMTTTAAYPADDPDRDFKMAFISRPVKEIVFGYDGDPLLAVLHGMIADIPTAFSGIITNLTSIEDTRARVQPDTVMTGYPEIEELRQYKLYQGLDAISVPTSLFDRSPSYPWHGVKEFGKVEGSDGGAFPMPVTPEDSPRLFAPSFYRPITLEYMQSLKHKGLSVHAFKIPDTLWLSKEEHPENANYYQDKYSGVLNISACANNLPLFVTRPRFAGVDEEFTSTITAEFPEDASTDIEDNESFFYIEPHSGLTVNVASTTMVSVGVQSFNLTYDQVQAPSRVAVSEARKFLEETAMEPIAYSLYDIGGSSSPRKTFSYDPAIGNTAFTSFADPAVMKAAPTMLADKLDKTLQTQSSDNNGISETVNKVFFEKMNLAYIPLFHANQTAGIGAADAASLASILNTIETVMNNTPAVAYSLASVLFLVSLFFLYRGYQGYKTHQNEGHFFLQSDNVDANFGGSAHFDPTMGALDVEGYERGSGSTRFRAGSYDDLNLLQGGQEEYGRHVTMDASPNSMYAASGNQKSSRK